MKSQIDKINYNRRRIIASKILFSCFFPISFLFQNSGEIANASVCMHIHTTLIAARCTRTHSDLSISTLIVRFLFGSLVGERSKIGCHYFFRRQFFPFIITTIKLSHFKRKMSGCVFHLAHMNMYGCKPINMISCELE